MWKMRCRIIPITRATRVVTYSLNKNSEATPKKHSVDSLQKTAVLGTAHTMRKVLQSETGRWGSLLVQGMYRGEKACDKGESSSSSSSSSMSVVP